MDTRAATSVLPDLPPSSGYDLVKRLVPRRARTWARERRLLLRPPLGWARVGGPWRRSPVSRSFGFDRGTPVDRYYIERFLAAHAGDIRGRVLEVGENRYTDRFGSGGAVERIDILDVDPANRYATLVLDLGAPRPPLGDARFDCIVCTQTLLLVYDLRAAVHNLYDLLAPGGVLLLTVPGISQICRDEALGWEDYWRFTSRSLQRLCEEAFPAEGVAVHAYGSVLTAAAFLYGLACEELRPGELAHRDPAYELVVAARAVRP